MDANSIQTTLEELIPWLTKYGIQVLGAIAILVIGRIIAGVLSNAAAKAMRKGNADPTLVGFVSGGVKLAILAFAVIAALARFGVQTTSFVAVLGAAGFAVGLALQGSLGNFASGVMLMIFRPIKVNDLIQVEGYLGIVEDIGIFVTTINTLDHQRVIIPNSTLTGGIINNVNGNGIRRVDLTIGISYGDNMQKAKDLCVDVMSKHPKVLSEPAPEIGVAEMGDSSVNLVVRPWCTGDDYWDVYFDITQQVKEAFDTNGITIPFPQRDVHLIQATN